MNNKIWLAIVIVLIIAFGITLSSRKSSDIAEVADNQAQHQTSSETADAEPEVLQKDDLIKVESLKANQKITSPLTITGEARGTWYFEASFPVRIEDANGKVLVQAPAQAQGEWTTENYVPFSVTLSFVKPQSGNGFIVFERDNPSGLPENANELRVPVQF